MSELKAYCPYANRDGFYHKSEVDKVIAEKDKEIAELKNCVDDFNKDFELVDNQNERLLKIVRHHNYKRCLAMASKCRLRARWFGDNAFYKKEQWALKWRKRWLELAEKFKEEK